MRRDSTIAKFAIAAVSGVVAYIVVDFLFSGAAPAVSFIAGVVAAWVAIRR